MEIQKDGEEGISNWKLGNWLVIVLFWCLIPGFYLLQISLVLVICLLVLFFMPCCLYASLPFKTTT
jgi:hypothetical protein